MKTSDLLSYCMDKPDAEQQLHQEWQATQVKSDGMLFAMFQFIDGRPAVSLKTSPALAELLREEHADVFPSRHLHKTHWSTLFLDGALKDSQLYYLVDASLQQALSTKGSA